MIIVGDDAIMGALGRLLFFFVFSGGDRMNMRRWMLKVEAL